MKPKMDAISAIKQIAHEQGRTVDEIIERLFEELAAASQQLSSERLATTR
jgi:hypothetical protein